MYLLYALYVVYFLYGLYFLREKTLTRSRERPGCTRETPREEVTNKSAAARVWKKTNQTGSGKITYYIVKRRKVAKKVTQPCRNSVRWPKRLPSPAEITSHLDQTKKL